MKKPSTFVFPLAIIVIIAIIAIGALSGKSSSDKKDNGNKDSTASSQSSSSSEAKEILTGFSLSPKSFGSPDFTNFFEVASKNGDIITWNGKWTFLADTTSAPYVVTKLAKTYRYKPVMIIPYFIDNKNSNGNTGSEVGEQYIAALVKYCEEYKPEYFGIGIETNILYKNSPSNFDRFVADFNSAYDRIKAVSPKTKIFTAIQLEQMKGLDGGFFGGVNDTSRNQWELLKRFEKADLIAFTTYPSLIYKDPGEVPVDYYSDIKNHTDKPIAISEMGWFRTTPIAGWESNEAELIRFLDIIKKNSSELKMEFVIWSFMYDQAVAQAPFNTMGILNSDQLTNSAIEKMKEIGD